MRSVIKFLLNRTSQLVALPFAVTCWLEQGLKKESEVVFFFWTNVFAILPGLPGVFLRRGFYSLTLQQCGLNCHIGFGSMFCHRKSIVEEYVYIGNYCTIGSAFLGQHCLIGSRVSLLSGNSQHVHDDETGEWGAFSQANIKQISIGRHAWIGEAAVIMADVGQGSQIAAGAVITANTKDYVVLAGNPARFVRKLTVHAQNINTPDQMEMVAHNIDENNEPLNHL